MNEWMNVSHMLDFSEDMFSFWSKTEQSRCIFLVHVCNKISSRQLGWHSENDMFTLWEFSTWQHYVYFVFSLKWERGILLVLDVRIETTSLFNNLIYIVPMEIWWMWNMCRFCLKHEHLLLESYICYIVILFMQYFISDYRFIFIESVTFVPEMVQ